MSKSEKLSQKELSELEKMKQHENTYFRDRR